MTADPSPSDEAAYQAYAARVNPSYPAFLTKMGLRHLGGRAEGALLSDAAGKKYLDCVAGYGIHNLGHNPPEIVRALVDQLQGTTQATRPLITTAQLELAEAIESVAPGDLCCSFVLSSGSEAVDAALKLARLVKRKPDILAAEGSFHGHTFGALSASGIAKFRRGFDPLVPGFDFVPYGDIDALGAAVTDTTAAVLLEAVQHEAGVTLPPPGYLEAVRNLCDERKLLLIFDEVKTGCGKTGRMFACEHDAVVPDLLVLGKSLGAGLIPMGAVVSKKKLWRHFGMSFSMSASSYAGNALACAVGTAVIGSLTPDLLADCAGKGRHLLDRLQLVVARYPRCLTGVEGIGLLLGVACASAREAQDIARAMIRRGVLVFPAFGNAAVIMIEPPLVISSDQVDSIADTLLAALEEVESARTKESNP